MLIHLKAHIFSRNWKEQLLDFMVAAFLLPVSLLHKTHSLAAIYNSFLSQLFSRLSRGFPASGDGGGAQLVPLILREKAKVEAKVKVKTSSHGKRVRSRQN